MTVLHLCFSAAAIVTLPAAPWPAPARLGAAVAFVAAVPAATLVYSGLRGGSYASPLRALLLYEVYYAARAAALAHLLFRRHHPARA